MEACLDILKEQWSPAPIIFKIQILMIHWCPETAHMYKTDRAKYEATACSWTQKYAMA